MNDTRTTAAGQDQEWHPQLEDDVHSGRSFPVWIWGCGGGCLVMLMLFIGVSVWFGDKMMSTFGPEAAWPVIGEIMPYGEEPPADYSPTLIDPRMITGMVSWVPGISKEDLDAEVPDMQVIVIDRTENDQRGDFTAMFYRLPLGATEEDKREVMDAPAVSPGAGEVEISGVEALELTLQGRKITGRRFDADSQGPPNPFGSQTAVQVLEIDLSEGRSRPLILQFTSNKKGAVLDGAALEDFLAPFQLWAGN